MCRSPRPRQTFRPRAAGQRLVEAGAQVETLPGPPDDHYYPELVGALSASVRRFLPALLRTVAFDGTQAGRPMLTAVAFLGTNSNPNVDPDMHQAPLDLVPWGLAPSRPPAAPGGSRSTRLYLLCDGTLARQSATARRVCPTQLIAGVIHASSCCKARSGRPCGPRSVGP